MDFRINSSYAVDPHANTLHKNIWPFQNKATIFWKIDTILLLLTMILPFAWYDLHYLDLKCYKSETFPKILEFSPLVLKSNLGHNWHIRTYHEFLLTELEWWLYKSQILFWHNDCGLTSYVFLESVILGLKMKKFNEGLKSIFYKKKGAKKSVARNFQKNCTWKFRVTDLF